MAFDLERIRTSSGKVAKFLRKNSKRPTSDAIHRLRTSTRSLETTFTTLGLDEKGKVRRLLRGLRDVRKRAGKVRDMDVLTADALTVQEHGEQDCLIRLLEHLGTERDRSARKLRRAIATSDPKLRQNLERSSRRLEKLLKRAKENPEDSDAVSATMAKTLQLSSALNSPARLTRKNLHPYRLKVKELRNVLQMSDRADETELVTKLGEVKDAIGEWHDWDELIAIAGKLLDHGPSCRLMKHLKATNDKKYERALSLVGDLRRNYLKAAGSKRRASEARKAPLSTSVLSATSAVAQQ